MYFLRHPDLLLSATKDFVQLNTSFLLNTHQKWHILHVKKVSPSQHLIFIGVMKVCYKHTPKLYCSHHEAKATKKKKKKCICAHTGTFYSLLAVKSLHLYFMFLSAAKNKTYPFHCIFTIFFLFFEVMLFC
uniref:ADP-ribosylation factor 1-like isoform X1 n=1 Tax=Rhizophora mucronata TaxID=61149 RepID=A0A2P2M1Q4_RHIMU